MYVFDPRVEILCELTVADLVLPICRQKGQGIKSSQLYEAGDR